jgi:hypothetical protein
VGTVVIEHGQDGVALEHVDGPARLRDTAA